MPSWSQGLPSQGHAGCEGAQALSRGSRDRTGQATEVNRKGQKLGGYLQAHPLLHRAIFWERS